MKACKNCNEELIRNKGESHSYFNDRKYCNRNCYKTYAVGKNASNYKRGYRVRPDGYLRYTDDSYVHRKVMEDHLGRKLESNEHVHHIDGDKSNNYPCNLMILSNSEHRKEHMKNVKRDDYGKFA